PGYCAQSLATASRMSAYSSWWSCWFSWLIGLTVGDVAPEAIELLLVVKPPQTSYALLLWRMNLHSKIGKDGFPSAQDLQRRGRELRAKQPTAPISSGLSSHAAIL